MTPTPIIILAGGRSARMGRDKLRLPFGGQSLLAAAVRRFSEVFPLVYVSAGEREVEDTGAPVLRDIFPGRGPLSGLHTALTRLDCGGVFLTAADMPFSDPREAERLIALALAGEYDAVAAAGDLDSRLEPLFAYYRKTLLAQADAAIRSESYSLNALLRAANTLRAPLADAKTLLNINSPEDYAALLSL
ncbi:MAG: molybdenum cofactor guanylyltransferase [Oscillospiraceae bacterium]|nr:molybdenum cofactor guanylyltransferase [Oscillospiraceae bacterium]